MIPESADARRFEEGEAEQHFWVRTSDGVATKALVEEAGEVGGGERGGG